MSLDDILKVIGSAGPRGFLLVVLGVLAVVVTFGLMAKEADGRGNDLIWSFKPLKFESRKRLNPDQTRELRLQSAMVRLQDLEQAMVLAVAAGPDPEERLHRWFNYLCGSLAETLAEGGHVRFRVSIWLDGASATDLELVAQHGFDANDPDMLTLARATSVAGWAIANHREHYVPDVDDDPIYKPRRSVPKYGSMIAVPLGNEADPWSALTVDCSVKNGLSEDQQALVRRFGVLASTAATLAAAGS